MSPKENLCTSRLTVAQLADYLSTFPRHIRDLATTLRDLVLRSAPAVQETIKFRALCYFKPGHPFKTIGGNVCLISPRQTCVRLEFIHGASLADPHRLLRGAAKAKRYIEACSRRDIRPRAFRALIRAALVHSLAVANAERDAKPPIQTASRTHGRSH